MLRGWCPSRTTPYGCSTAYGAVGEQWFWIALGVSIAVGVTGMLLSSKFKPDNPEGEADPADK